MKLTGKVHKYGANVDTDVIIPARYLNIHEDAELARHCMEDLDSEFVNKVRSGDIIVAESNFGCGSSREHAPRCIGAAGISCIIAASFARIFYRNSINIGLPILECPEAVVGIADGDALEVDLQTGAIVNLTSGKSYQALPYPEFMLQIINAGGLIPYVRARVEAIGL